MSPIKFVVSDLDGTLLSEENELEEEVIHAVEAFRAIGGRFTIATGRPLITALPIIDKLNIDLPVILCNGAAIAKNGQIVEQNNFRVTEVMDLLVEGHRQGLTILIFCQSAIFTFQHTTEARQYEHKERIKCTVVSAQQVRGLDKRADKVILMGDIRISLALWHRYEGLLGDRIDVYQSEYNYLELVAKHCSKGSAVSSVAELLGINREHIMTIGNEMNDLPMYAASAIGVAVANGRMELKEAADYVCRQTYGQGVAEAIRRFALHPEG